MTDRIDSVTVILDRDYRDDDVDAILDALRMTKGVLKVVAHVSDPSEAIAEARRDFVWRDALRRLDREGPVF